MNLALAPELSTAVRAALTPFAINPTADSLCDLSRAMSQMTAYANSGNFRNSADRDREIPGYWIDSYFACDHAHEHIQNVNRTFATGGAPPTPLDVRTVKYAVLAATALFDDAVRNNTPPPTDKYGRYNPDPGTEYTHSISDIAGAAVRLLGHHWHAEPGLHGTSGQFKLPGGEDYLLAVGDVGDRSPEMYVQHGDTRHVLWDTDSEDLPALAQRVADTIRALAQD